MLLLLYVIHTFTGFFEIFLIVDLVSWIGQLLAELFVEILESDFSTLKFLSIPTDVNIFVRRLSRVACIYLERSILALLDTVSNSLALVCSYVGLSLMNLHGDIDIIPWKPVFLFVSMDTGHGGTHADTTSKWSQ